MTTPLVVARAGGFGRETLALIEAINTAAPWPAQSFAGGPPVWKVLGVLDHAGTTVVGVPARPSIRFPSA